jgi:hypothetical protein
MRHSNIEVTREYDARRLPAVETRWIKMLDAYAATEIDGNRTDEAAI